MKASSNITSLSGLLKLRVFRYTYYLRYLLNPSNGRWRGYGASLADDYLAEGDYNVFSVDWGDLESWANYPHAAAVTRPVGEFAAELGRRPAATPALAGHWR